MTDRLPPHSEENEQAVLGCMLLDPNECIPECIAKLPGAEVFYDLRHQVIYAQMVAMYDAREAVDLVTVQQRLKNAGELDEVGGVAYLSMLPAGVPSAANLPTYLESVTGLFMLRRAVHIFQTAVSDIYGHEGDPKEILDHVESEVMRLSMMRQAKVEKTAKDYVRNALAEIENTFSRRGQLSGINTGYTDINRLTDGLQPGHMIVIGGRPGSGKSTLFMNIVEHVVLSEHLSVGVFSLEMTGEEIFKRAIASQAEVNLRDLGDGRANEMQLSRITRAAGALSTSGLYVDDRSGLSIMQIRSKARQWVQRYKIKLLCIDYLQLANALGSKRKHENRQQEVTEISNGIKTLAKELGIPIIVLSQFNREMDKDKQRKPRMSDCRESGSIENEADLALLLYQAPERDDDEYNDLITPVNALVGKNRHGRAGHDIEFLFFKEYTKFKPRARVAESDIPQ